MLRLVELQSLYTLHIIHIERNERTVGNCYSLTIGLSPPVSLCYTIYIYT